MKTFFKGNTRLQTRKIIRRFTDRDLSYKSGKIIGSMCTPPHKCSRYFSAKYNSVNLGDPGLFPGSADLEQRAIRQLGMLFHNNNAAGSFVTGGTEANLLAMLTAKEFSGDKRKVVLPESAHFSFDKAAKLMGLELVKIPLTKNMTIDIEIAAKEIDEQTMAVVGVAGTTGLGAVDNIRKLGELCRRHNTYLHVDAAFGGFVLPFLANQEIDFDFTIPEVKSITVDPHKMGGGTIPTGCILYRNEKTASLSQIEVTYLSGGKTTHRTIVGTRSGSSVIASIAAILRQGASGFLKTTAKCMKLTDYMYTHIQQMDNISAVIQPVMNVIGLRSNLTTSSELYLQLKNRGWAVSYFDSFLRIVIMPHVRKKDIDLFLHDLKEITQYELQKRRDK